MMEVDDRQEALKLAVSEARRFISKAEAAHEALDACRIYEPCPEYAAAKRASMDLTKALVPVRHRNLS